MPLLAIVKITILSFCMMLSINCELAAQPVRQIKPATELISGRAPGGMGVSVVWNPGMKRYYAAVSGNGERWLFMYDEKGKALKSPYLLPFDPGSLWLEGAGKILKSYASGMEGLYVIHLREGLPAYAENIFYALHNPVAIGNGAWAGRKKEMWYYHDKAIFRYKIRHAHHRPPLHLDIDDFDNELNSMGVVYTGIRNAEIGLYDRGQHRILLYNSRSGRCTKILQILDDNGPKPLCGDFAYTNGIFWLYSRETGNWHGYR